MGTKTKTSSEHSEQLPQANHRETTSISPVYHVGDLAGDREKPHTSHEGKGVSVSVHPHAWEQIMRGDGTSTHEILTTYELTNQDPEFYFIDPLETLTVEREWCLDKGFVAFEQGYRVTYENGTGETAYMEFHSKETAKLEAKSHGGEYEQTEILTLGPEGVKYWMDAFRQPPVNADPVLINGLTPVWYAEANGYDGVWWDEAYDPSNYSAPRGVIFQSKFDAWEQSVQQQTESV